MSEQNRTTLLKIAIFVDKSQKLLKNTFEKTLKIHTIKCEGLGNNISAVYKNGNCALVTKPNNRQSRWNFQTCYVIIVFGFIFSRYGSTYHVHQRRRRSRNKRDKPIIGRSKDDGGAGANIRNSKMQSRPFLLIRRNRLRFGQGTSWNVGQRDPRVVVQRTVYYHHVSSWVARACAQVFRGQVPKYGESLWVRDSGVCQRIRRAWSHSRLKFSCWSTTGYNFPIHLFI